MREISEEKVIKIFKETGVLITDSHIVYTSGRHGSAYINKDAVFPYTRIIKRLCGEIADHFGRVDVDIVAGPAIGGAILAQYVAYYLCRPEDQKEVLAIYAEEAIDEKGEKIKIFKRGYDKRIPGKRVLVVEDVLTTGGSAKKVIEAVRKLGGEVVGLGVLCNRGEVKPENVGVEEIFALSEIKMDSYPEEDCPLCKENIPINLQVGKGKEFLAEKYL